MANRVNKGRQSLGAAHLVGKISQVGDFATPRKMSNEHDDNCINHFKREQSALISRVCPAFGAAYHPAGNKHSMDKGSD